MASSQVRSVRAGAPWLVNPLLGALNDDADAVQFFLGDPQSWKKPKPREDADMLRRSPIPLYVHAPYLINVASANNRVRIPSRKILQDSCDAAGEIGATAANLLFDGGAYTELGLTLNAALPEVVPAAADAVVDPTGCGDAYRAGLIFGLMKGMDMATAGRIASLMGALKIEHLGRGLGRPGHNQRRKAKGKDGTHQSPVATSCQFGSCTPIGRANVQASR